MAFSESNASDDISLFLRQLLQRSSSPRPAPPHQHHSSIPSFSSLGTSSPLPPPLPHNSVKQQPQSSGFVSSTAPLPVADGGVVQSGVLDSYYQLPSRSAAFSGSDQVSHAVDHTGFGTAGESFSDRYYLPGCGGSSDYMAVSVSAVESESVTVAGSVLMRSSENEVEDQDYESEEGAEPVMEGGVLVQQNPSRSSSKRSRAAEVHNMSEKRRRSKINEKMKALQNLIPNSNKTDKASMLDEAIEYLKQLQLQVQMLSIRNGLSLHPMCLPGVSGLLHPSQLSQLGITFDSSRDGPFLPDDPTTTTGPSLDQTQQQYGPGPSSAMAATTVPSSSSALRGMINADSSFAAMDSSSSSSSTPNQLASFTLPHHSHQEGIREDDISYQQSIINHRQPDRLEEFKTAGMMMPMPMPMSLPISPPTTSKFGGPHQSSSGARDQDTAAAADQHVHHLLASNHQQL